MERTNNELIARFMGWNIIDATEYDPAFYESPNVLCNYEYFQGTKYHKHDELFFHTSWDWLMPVIEKISQHVYDSQEEDDGTGKKRIIEYRAYPRTFGMISTEGKWLFRFNRMPLEEGDTLIEAAYKAVVEYIKAPK